MENKFQTLVESRAIDTTLVEFSPVVSAVARHAIKGAVKGAASETARVWLGSKGNIDKKLQKTMDDANGVTGGNNTSNNSSNYGKERNSNQNYNRNQQGIKVAKDDDPRNLRVTQISSQRAFKPEQGPDKIRSSLATSKGLGKKNSGTFKSIAKGAVSSIFKGMQTK